MTETASPEHCDLAGWQRSGAFGSALPSGRVDLHLLDLESGEIAPLYATLSPDERARADRYRTAELRNRFVRARGGMRRLLGRYLDIAPSRLVFAYGELGKPRVESADLEFNFSHSGGRALLAVARGQPVGVDLEPVRPLPGMERIARRVFEQEFLHDLLECPKTQRCECFFRHWTALEAVAKLHGNGVFSAGRQAAAWRCHLTPESGWIGCLALGSKPREIRGYCHLGGC